MNLQTIFRTGTLVLIFIASATIGLAQQAEKSTLVIGQTQMRLPVAGKNNLYCAGYVETGRVNTKNEIVGGEYEQEQFVYAQGDNVYLSMGARTGLKVGDMLAVIRPRGRVETKWTKKKNLGFYVQEVGAVEIIKVGAETSVAKIVASCDNMLLGDLVQPIPNRTSPLFENRPPLDLFADRTGKVSGKIFMARDNIELIGRDQIVYIDLGAEDSIKVGDYMTIYRPLGKGNIIDTLPNESVAARSDGFQSEEYQGGKFSNQAGRKSGEQANGRVITTNRAKRNRQPNLRNIVGELVILNVKQKTATAIITRTAMEIHTGDSVELQ